MLLNAQNALIIGCTVGGALILIALVIVIVFVVIYFSLCCKLGAGDKYASNLTGHNSKDSSLEKKYSSQNGLPPTGLGLWAKMPSMQTGSAPGTSAVSAFYKTDHKESFVRNKDEQRQKANAKDGNDVQTSGTVAPPFEWPSIDEDRRNSTFYNSFSSQVKLISTDANRGVPVTNVNRLEKPADPVPNTKTSAATSGGGKINVEAIIENSSRPLNGKMTIPPFEKQLIGDAFKFLEEEE